MRPPIHEKTPARARRTAPRTVAPIIGWRERVALPDLRLSDVRAKIDTGARTTALHASRIKTFRRDGALWVSFHPEHAGLPGAELCEAPVHGRRAITNTSGQPEERIVVRTHLQIAGLSLFIELSLADRAEMTFPIIVGRSAIRRRLLVDSGRSWLTSPFEASET